MQVPFIRGNTLYEAAQRVLSEAPEGSRREDMIDNFAWIPENEVQPGDVGPAEKYPIEGKILELIHGIWPELKATIANPSVAKPNYVVILSAIQGFANSLIPKPQKWTRLLQTLNEPATATYKQLILKYHPDKHPGATEQEREFYNRISQYLTKFKP